MCDWCQRCCSNLYFWSTGVEGDQSSLPSYDVNELEDGDLLQQQLNLNRTLEIIRQMMNQPGTQITEQPPPAYEDFAKYPLAVESVPKQCSADNPRGNSSAVVNPSQSTGLPERISVTSSPSTPWMEPFPKPPGEPPPVPNSWLRLRLASWGRSFRSLFQTVAPTPRVHPQSDGSTNEVTSNGSVGETSIQSEPVGPSPDDRSHTESVVDVESDEDVMSSRPDSLDNTTLCSNSQPKMESYSNSELLETESACDYTTHTESTLQNEG